MELIVLKGKENTGKTTTINYVYNKLRGEGYIESSPKDFKDLGDVDFLTVLEKDGVKIGVVSQGDEADKIPIYLKKLKEKDCQKVICALRKEIEKEVNLLEISKNTILKEIEINKAKPNSFEQRKNVINGKVTEILNYLKDSLKTL